MVMIIGDDDDDDTSHLFGNFRTLLLVTITYRTSGISQIPQKLPVLSILECVSPHNYNLNIIKYVIFNNE